MILPVTRAFQPIHSVPAHGRGRELRVYPVLWAGAGHSGPCYTPPIHAPHLDLCCGGSSATSRVGFRHCTPRRGGVLVPYLPARRLLPHTLPAAGGSVALTTRGSAHTALPPQTRHTQASLPLEHEWSSPFGPGRAGSELTARGQMGLLQASGALAIG